MFVATVLKIVCILSVLAARATVAKPSDHVVSHAKIKEAALVIVNDCRDQEGASEDDVKALQAHEMPQSQQGLCMMQCLFNTAKVMKNGKVSKEGAVEFFSPALKDDEDRMEKMHQMIDVCIKEIGDLDDGCQVAKLFVECTNKHGKEFGFNFPNHVKN